MPWRNQTIMDERARFAIEAEHSVFSFAELCRRYHINRGMGIQPARLSCHWGRLRVRRVMERPGCTGHEAAIPGTAGFAGGPHLGARLTTGCADPE
jgi:hypothetical protein